MFKIEIKLIMANTLRKFPLGVLCASLVENFK